LVEFDGTLEPAGVGVRTDVDEEASRPEGPACAGAVVLDHDSVQIVLSYAG
jgi:hypothetical protein